MSQKAQVRVSGESSRTTANKILRDYLNQTVAKTVAIELDINKRTAVIVSVPNDSDIKKRVCGTKKHEELKEML